eukprot:TRINITY_DN2219_c0_g1_i1.p1 TRINITY_DN2219_c0_g1~~TRINITY_DN2219_c0_g1_i1.p1  ORF type:complete len:293 (-),score=156.41 TRINITY_DN2219_c0_g1_i1:104-982(-)
MNFLNSFIKEVDNELKKPAHQRPVHQQPAVQHSAEQEFPTSSASAADEEDDDASQRPAGQEDIDGPGKNRDLPPEVVEFRRGLLGPGGSDKIASGLKEALSTCVENAIAIVGKSDGFLGNSAIKIMLPDQLQQIGTALRSIGLGPKIDEFEVSMNRAAERAAPASREVVKKAVMGLSFDDVQNIWNGKNSQGVKTSSAITDYFQEKIGADLLTAFSPIIDQAIEETTVTRQFNKLSSKSRGLPIVGDAFDIDIGTYTKKKTIEGLFTILKQEEVKIRKDPAARITDVLKMMF